MATTASAKKLIVEVVDARDLLPKDGAGASSPYVVVDFDGQRKRTRTAHRDLNPTWNEVLEFDVVSSAADAEVLEVDVLHDRKLAPAGRRNNFLGRLRLDSRQFVGKGEEALIHFPLQKKSFFSWVRGDLGLRIYFADGPAPVPVPVEEPAAPEVPPQPAAAEIEKPAAAAEPAPAPPEADSSTVAVDAEKKAAEEPAAKVESPSPAPDVSEAGPPPDFSNMDSAKSPGEEGPPPEEPTTAHEEATSEPPLPPPLPEPKQVLWLRQMSPLPRPTERPSESPVERSKFDLVEKMQYLFVRVVRARSLPAAAAGPHVRITVSGTTVTTGPARKAAFFEWDETFAFPRNDLSSSSSDAAPLSGCPLEVSVWVLPPDTDDAITGEGNHFLGGLCFDTSDVPVRDPPDSPLATQWYRLEGGEARKGDLMLATWIGTQADDSFHHAWRADDVANGHVSSGRSKVYLSPKLWYLRLTVIEAQELPLTPTASILPVSVRVSLGFQAVRSRFSTSRTGSPLWNEDLILVVAEPFGDQKLALSLESRQSKDLAPSPTLLLGSASLLLSSVERRVDDRLVAARWLALDPPKGSTAGTSAARIHLRVCLDGGYHVADEPTHATSDYRPSARQLWKRPMGAVELGIIGCRGLLPVKTVDGKGCTDPFAVAKYGPKWARTRTIAGSLDPAWNEQYTWEVYDPSTILTVAVFDDDDGGATAFPKPMGRVRIRISALEDQRPYRRFYPLLLLHPTGMKRMGEVELAVRFSRAVPPLDFLQVYAQPLLPPMHHLKPIPPAQREPLRAAAARIVAAHLARSDPPLRREAVAYVLEADGPTRFSMRKVRSNWQRIVTSFAWLVESAKWTAELRTWKNPTAAIMMHGVLILLIWYPDLIAPAVALHAAIVGALKYRSRPRGPEPPSEEWTAVAADEVEEELESPWGGGKAGQDAAVRARYERLKAVAARVQAFLGGVAEGGERVVALVAWRDPRATGVFVALCLLVAAVMFVMPTKVVAAAAGFYWLRHPVLRDRAPPAVVNFFRRLPSQSERFL